MLVMLTDASSMKLELWMEYLPAEDWNEKKRKENRELSE